MLFFKRRGKNASDASKKSAEDRRKDLELQEELSELSAAELPRDVDRAKNEAERTASDAALSEIRDISLIERGRCPECGNRTEQMVSSRVCTNCGWYRWRSEEANSCVVYLDTGQKLKCDRIYSVKHDQVLLVRDDVVRNVVSQSAIRRIDYVWDEEKLETARRRFHLEVTGVCDWCGTNLSDLKAGEEPLADHVAFGAFQERFLFCCDKCLASFRKQYPTRIHRNCYETDCNTCEQCIKRYDTGNVVRIKLKDPLK